MKFNHGGRCGSPRATGEEGRYPGSERYFKTPPWIVLKREPLWFERQAKKMSGSCRESDGGGDDGGVGSGRGGSEGRIGMAGVVETG